MRVVVDVYGDDLVARDLLRFSERPNNMAPVWDDVTDDVLAPAFERNFKQQGPGWAPLKPSTVRSRIAQGYPAGPILTKTGAYRREMTSGLQTQRSNNELVVVAPKVPGAYHQSGTRKMPARPLRLTESEKRAVVKTIQRYLIEGWYG
jgi:phage gpG-like protein